MTYSDADKIRDAVVNQGDKIYSKLSETDCDIYKTSKDVNLLTEWAVALGIMGLIAGCLLLAIAILLGMILGKM